MQVENSPASALRQRHLIAASSLLRPQASQGVTTQPVAAVPDKVSLSTEGLKAATETTKGLEQYALPAWVTDFQPEISNLSFSSAAVEEGRAFVEFSNNVTGNSPAAQKAVQAYLSNMPATQHRKDVESFYAQHKNLFDEFAVLHNTAIDESMHELGLSTTEQAMTATDNHENLRQSIMQKMLGNPHAVELMSTLGIKQPDV